MKTALIVFSTILCTGAVLNYAGRGAFGDTVRRGAQFVTAGYGV